MLLFAARCWASAAYMPLCLSVRLSIRLSRSWILTKRINISSFFLHRRIITSFRFYVRKVMTIFQRGLPPNGGVECRLVGTNRDCRPISGYRSMTAGASAINNWGRPSSSISHLRCTSVYGTGSHASLNTPKRREQKLIYEALKLKRKYGW